MDRGVWRVIAAAAMTLMTTLPAAAQTAQQWKCTGNPDVPWDDQIVACTSVIASGKYSGKHATWAYNNRGVAYQAKGDNDRAIADYNQAIALDPKYA
jgi:tetratricopeptide (TPR) repeat protein